MEERWTFNDPATPTRVADKVGNQYVSDRFLGEGNTHKNVEDGLRQGLPERADKVVRGGGGYSCDTCNKPFAGAEMFGFENKRFHKASRMGNGWLCVLLTIAQECFVLDKPCGDCNKRILREEFVTADNNTFYHPKCAPKSGARSIESVVAPMAKMTMEKKPDAASEAERLRLAGKINEGKVSCPACHKVIGGMSVTFQGNSYHAECMRCSGHCGAMLADKVFSLTDEGKPICADCHLGGAKCVGCLKPLTAGAFVTAGRHKYHPDCFICKLCKTNLRGKPYADVKGEVRCANCLNR